jgi:hypothetical protein
MPNGRSDFILPLGTARVRFTSSHLLSCVRSRRRQSSIQPRCHDHRSSVWAGSPTMSALLRVSNVVPSVVGQFVGRTTTVLKIHGGARVWDGSRVRQAERFERGHKRSGRTPSHLLCRAAGILMRSRALPPGAGRASTLPPLHLMVEPRHRCGRRRLRPAP